MRRIDMAEGSKRSRVSLAAETAFREQLKRLGADLLEPEYLGSRVRHYVRCPVGHDCYPRPGNVARGQGICRACVGHDPATAEAAFRARLEALGAELLEPAWLGRQVRHHVRCPAGHDCNPRPGDVLRGGNPCRICSKRDPETAWLVFRKRIEGFGAELIETEWLGASRPHRVRCRAGHECRPVPAGLERGRGICRTCAGNDAKAAEAAFRARLDEVGAIPLYVKYRGAGNPHRVRCACGSDCYPRPNDVQQGHGFCASCAGQSHDVFYVVEHQRQPVVKFGISARRGRQRLHTHREDGFSIVHLLETGLMEGTAAAAEKAVLAALALAGERPVHGREYFDLSCLALILDIATGWLPAIRPVVA